MIFKCPDGRTIISDSDFGSDPQFMRTLREIIPNKIYATSQLFDLNYYDKSKWITNRTEYTLWNKDQGTYVSEGKRGVIDAFLFNSYSSSKNEVMLIRDFIKVELEEVGSPKDCYWVIAYLDDESRSRYPIDVLMNKRGNYLALPKSNDVIVKFYSKDFSLLKSLAFKTKA